jgi:hypothetical protein
MSYYSTLHCTHPGCTDWVIVPQEHLANLMASGGWSCWRHEDDRLDGVLAEVPC